MVLHNLCIVNKFGGLVYVRDFSNKVQMSGNDYLRVASTFHSLHEISSKISPIEKPAKSPDTPPNLGSDGIEVIEADNFNLSCFKAPTGVMIFVTADPETVQLGYFLQRVYASYADYVLKDPFYQLDQVVKSEKFEKQLEFLARDLLRQTQKSILSTGI